MIPQAYARVLAHVDRALALLPWLPRPGVRVGQNAGALYYQWSLAEQSAFIIVPADPWADTFPEPDLRRVTTHEMGHLWADALGRRRGGSYDIYPDLGITEQNSGSYWSQRNEIAAEIFARTLGESPSYIGGALPDLRPYTEPTPPRIAFVETSGTLPDMTAEKVQLGAAIGLFWARTDIPQFFRDWAANYQRYLELYVLEPLRRSRGG